jgi:hypothetical protein
MPYKDVEKRKEYQRQYQKVFYLKNKVKKLEKNKEYSKKYRLTPNGKKSIRISDWKRRNIIFFDYDLLYEIYTDCKYCDYCKCEFNSSFNNQKCLDHDHSIKEYDNVRGVLCQRCNLKDVLKL